MTERRQPGPLIRIYAQRGAGSHAPVGLQHGYGTPPRQPARQASTEWTAATQPPAGRHFVGWSCMSTRKLVNGIAEWSSRDPN